MLEPTRKLCSNCHSWKNKKYFRKISRKGSNLLRAECNQCLAERCKAFRKLNPGYGQKWKKANPELNTKYAWRVDLKAKYGLSEQDYNNILIKQENKCAVCAKPFTGTPNVDHNHLTGKVRGLTCRPCNRGLGMFKDNIGELRKAINYLRRTDGKF